MQIQAFKHDHQSVLKSSENVTFYIHANEMEFRMILTLAMLNKTCSVIFKQYDCGKMRKLNEKNLQNLKEKINGEQRKHFSKVENYTWRFLHCI